MRFGSGPDDAPSDQDLADRRAALVYRLSQARTLGEVAEAQLALARFDRQHPGSTDQTVEPPDRHAQIRGILPRPGVAGTLLHRGHRPPHARS